jgi:high-affinity iron transporter
MRRTLPLLLLAACASESGHAPPPSAPDVAEKVRRLAGILDYVGADYPGVVECQATACTLSAAGQSGEYQEQLDFLRDAAAMAAELPPPARPIDLAGGIGSLRQAIERKRPPAEVSEPVRALRREVLTAWNVVLAPTTTPSMAVAREQFAACATCHGEQGGGDGPGAAGLNPPPRSFRDPEVLASLSPVRAYGAISDGIAGTAMTPYSGTLSPSQRWSLAFGLFRFTADEAAVARGRAAFAARGGLAATASRLANRSNSELDAELVAAGYADPVERADVIAWLRIEAPFQTSGKPMDRARELLAAAAVAYDAGNRSDARRDAAAAYLDGFEPHEAPLRAIDDDLVIRVEGEFLALREAIADGGPPAEVDQRVLRIGALLDVAEERLAGGGGAGAAFAAAFVIVLREGFEGALLVLLLLGIARRSGAAAREVRAVHYGWLVAIGVGAVTWVASGQIIGALGGAQRELIEGVIALFAAVVLLAASHFVLARLDAARRVAALKERLARSVSSPRRRLVLASLAFVAVYREAFETVLFLQAVLLDGNSPWAWVALGMVTAGVVLIGLVFAMSRLGVKLKPGPLLTGLGLLLCLLAVALAGKGVRALQEAGTIGIEPLGRLRFEWLGVYPTLQTLAAQAVVLVAFGALTAWALLRNRGATEAATASSAASAK